MGPAARCGSTEVELRYRLSWSDSLVVSAAQPQGCTVLLTEDLQDGAMLGGVAVRSPFTLAIEQAVATYAVAPRVMRGHPSRGRPNARPLSEKGYV